MHTSAMPFLPTPRTLSAWLNIRWPFGLLLIFAIGLLSACGGGSDAPISPSAPPISITAQPNDQMVAAGDNAVFSITATGAGLSYQWQRSVDGGTTWGNIADATSSSFVVSAATTNLTGSRYRVLATGLSGSVTSSAVGLTVTATPVPPAITVDVASAIVAAVSGDAVFSVTASGTSLTYQWQSSIDGLTWIVVFDATGPSLRLAGLTASDNGKRYRVIISNRVGSITSSAVVLTVGSSPDAPIISSQPASVSVTAPGPASFAVVASGTPAPSYQWQRSNDAGATFTDIPTATGASYSLASTNAADNGAIFRVRIANLAGTVVSAAAMLSVAPAPVAPVIVDQPASTTVVVSALPTFRVNATGTPTPTYQWQISTDGGTTFANINGATAPDYAAPAATIGDDGKRFRVVVSNSAGNVTSAAAALMVIEAPIAPIVQAPPQPLSVKAPASATFTVVVSGKPTPTIQWQKSSNNGTFTDIAAANGASYTTPATALTDNGSQYRVRVANIAGTAISAAAVLTVTPADEAPIIGTQPVAVTVTAPFAATFTVVASGSPTPSYQWQISSDSINWTNISGAIAASYTTPATSTADSGLRYRVLVTNSAASVISTAVPLTVNAASPASVLTGRAWTAGKLVDAYNGTSAEAVQVAIDDAGTATLVALKSNGSRRVLLASRGTPGVAGSEPTWTTPQAIDLAGSTVYPYGPSILYDPWYGVAAAPNGDAYVVWTTSLPCTASSSYTGGECVYLVLAKYSAASAVWQAPVIIAENFGSAAPVFMANANGDFAMLFRGFERVAGSPLARTAMAWRKRGTSNFVQRTFPVTSSSFGMDGNGNLALFGEVSQNATIDYVVYRGNVTAGFGAQEVIDTRLSAATAEVAAAVGIGGHAVGFFSQDDGTGTRLYSATAASFGDALAVTDMRTLPPGLLSLAPPIVRVLDSGDAILRQDCSARRWSAATQTWSAASTTSGICSIAYSFYDLVAVSPSADALRVEWNTGRWATYDAGNNRMIQSFSSSSTPPASSFVYGVNAPLVVGTSARWDYALSTSGIGVLVVLTTRDTLPTASAPAGIGRNGVYNVWALFLK